MACTNRDTIKIAAANGIGALAFSFLDPEEAKTWSEIYYGIIKSDECVPIGHAVNANMAMVSNFSVHHDRAEAIRRGQEGFEFFSYAVNALVAHDALPGRSTLFADFQRSRARSDEEIIAAARAAARNANGIGTPDDIRQHIEGFRDAGVDQVIFLQQAGRNRHEHICQSLELFAAEVMPQFKAEVAEREARKTAELAPYIEAAMARKRWMKPLADDEIPVVPASRARAQINQAG
jgi:alkanesulfonate monooxygenase SsuD/methylene tetrahydromethanopterin reductase-like flavin-dependent oxidoreductase (luciferase family)